MLWEYKDRGKKGYDLTERMFVILHQKFPELQLSGPERAGKDVQLRTIFPDYTKQERPIDFLISDGADVLAVGLARYDGDRGGAQRSSSSTTAPACCSAPCGTTTPTSRTSTPAT